MRVQVGARFLGLRWGPGLMVDTLDGIRAPVENGGKHPTIYRVSTILLVVQDFAIIHSTYGLDHSPISRFPTLSTGRRA